MKQYSFDTVRIVCLRNEDNTEDDEFFVDILADGVSTRQLEKDKREEVSAFVVGLFQSLNQQCIDKYGKTIDANQEGWTGTLGR